MANPTELDLSANYNPNGDFVEVVMYPHAGSQYLAHQVVSGYAKLLYTSTDDFGTATNIELARADVNNAFSDDEHKFNIKFNHPPRIIDLKVSAQVLLNSQTYTKVVDVLTDTVKLPVTDNTQQEPYNEYPDYEQPPKIDDRDSVTLITPLDPIMLHVDFDRESPIIKGTGDIGYAGGGYRYLPDAFGNIIEQDQNVAPWLVHASTYLEDERDNLLSNNDFSGITGDSGGNLSPVGYAASSSNIMLVANVTGDSVIETNHWALHYRLGNWTYPTAGNSTPVSIDITQPLTCAMFLGVYPQLTEYNLKKVTLKLKFYTVAGALLGTKDVDYTAASLLNSLYVIQNTAAITNYPAGTAKASFELVFSSLVQGDDIEVRMALPQFIQLNRLESFINGLHTRLGDRVYLDQPGNVNSDVGGFIIRFIPGYTGYHPNAGGGYLLDSRDDTSLQYGFALLHRHDGKFEFIIDIGGIPYSMTSTLPQVLTADSEVELKATWSKNTPERRLYLNGIQIGLDSSPFETPTSLSSHIYLGSRADGTLHLGCQMTEFIVMRSNS